MSLLGIRQLAQRLGLALLSVALLAYLGSLLADLYRSRNELLLYQQEQLTRESGKRAQALEYFFSERMKDMRNLAENRELRVYFENKALGMSLQYGLAASLFDAKESLADFRHKSQLGALEIYPRILFLDERGETLVDVGSAASPAPTLPGSGPMAADAPVEPSLSVVEGQLVAEILFQFKARPGGRLVALLSVPSIYQHFVGGDDPSKQLIALCHDDQLLFAAHAPGALLDEASIRAALARGPTETLPSSLGVMGPSNVELSALRTPIGGTRLSLVTFMPTSELRPQSPGRLIAVFGGIGALLLLLALYTALNNRRSLETLEQLYRRTPFGIAVVSRDRMVLQANDAAGAIFSLSPRALAGQPWHRFVPALPPGKTPLPSGEVAAVDSRGQPRSLLLSEIPTRLGDEDGFIEAFVDLSERKHLEFQLRQAQKLEAVGQLAAGLAHEINTPTQYVSDSLEFMQTTFDDLQRLLGTYRGALCDLPATDEHLALQDAMRSAEESVDLAFLTESTPGAFERAKEGLSRVASIVGAMKEFAQADLREKSPADLNRALQNTLTVARAEYQSVAEVEAQLEALPPVMCHLGEMNQVFLSLVVNAAHAIGDVVGTSGEKGRIRVRTACLGDTVRIDVEDTGCGIPEEIRHRVFDPFFTTKPVGKGTGQGLAIARSVVVDKHGGSLSFESTVGRGTTFTVVLPVTTA